MTVLTRRVNVKKNIGLPTGGLMIVRFFRISIVSLGLTACGSQTNSVLKIEDSRVQLKNTELSLKVKSPVKFTYVASVDAPLIPKTKDQLQATAFDFYKDYAYVVYNMAGADIKGAIEVVDFSSWKEPELLSSVYFENAEFSDVKVQNAFVYAVGVETGEHEGAVFKIFKHVEKEKPLQAVASVSLEGFVATSIQLDGSVAYVSVGDNSGIFEINIKNPERPEIIHQWKLAQAKFVLPIKDSFLALGGESSTDFFEPIKSELNSVLEVSRNIYEAPGRMSVYGNHIYTNAGQLGFRVYDIKDWKKASLQEIAAFELKGTGNGIDVSSDMAFLAQGEMGAGVYSVKNPERPEEMGYFDFEDDRGSANNIRHGKVGSENLLMIADGVGGFRIVHFDLL